MIEHKEEDFKDLRSSIMLLKICGGIDEGKKNELREKYKKDKTVTLSENTQGILIGNWLNNVTRLTIKGATEEEINKVIEHIIVLIDLRKYNLDHYKSYKDHDLLSIMRKYFSDDELVTATVVKVSENRKEMAKKKETNRMVVFEEVRALKDKNLNNAEIAEKLQLPESTVRALSKEK